VAGKTEINYYATNGVTITYMEDPYPVQNKLGEQKLVVIFQSLGDEKSDDPAKRFPYTLIDGLKFYNCRKIYVKDSEGLVGTYYLGLNGKLDIKEAVIEFLKNKIKEYKISPENLIMFGFSKGGYAALMFGFELGAGHIITAVPQFDLTSWIYKYKPHLTYILPNNPSDEDKKFYKNYLKNTILQSEHRPDVYLITSKNDNTHDDHIPQLLETLAMKNITPYVYYNNNDFVTRHNNVVINSMNEILTILGMLLCDEKVRSFWSNR